MLANIGYMLIAAVLIGLGVYVAWHGEFSVRVRYGYRQFHGATAWLLAAGLISGGTSAAIVVWGRLIDGRGRQRVALILALAGAAMVLAAQFGSLFGLV